MNKYLKPCISSYSAQTLLEVIGPIQASSVELQIYYQQIPEPQAKLDKIEKTIMLADAEKPVIYKIDNIA